MKTMKMVDGAVIELAEGDGEPLKGSEYSYRWPGPDAVCQLCGEPSPYQEAHGECMAYLVGLQGLTTLPE